MENTRPKKSKLVRGLQIAGAAAGLAFAGTSLVDKYSSSRFPTNTSQQTPIVASTPIAHKTTQRPSPKPVKLEEIVNATQTRKTNSLEAYADYIAPFEGLRTKVYDPDPDDGKPEPTIAVGFYMDRAGGKKDFEKILPGVNFEKVKSGKLELTEAQAKKLFANDLQTYAERAKIYLTNFDLYPEYLGAALVNSFYRGDIGPKTIKLINKGKWEKVAGEYLDHRGYKTARQRGKSGIIRRMNANASRMRKYAKSLKGQEVKVPIYAESKASASSGEN